MISSESSDDELLPRPPAALKRRRKVPKTAKEATEAGDTAGSDSIGPNPSLDAAEAQKLKREARKKRKKDAKAALLVTQAQQKQDQAATERAVKGRAYTLSLAIPGSILDNAQTKELKTYVAGQVARAAVIFQVDEIIVFNDQLGARNASTGVPVSRVQDCHVMMARILQYLETPQYLRRHLFPMHRDLSCAGLLNPLDCPHHVRAEEWSDYREGVVTDRPLKDKEGSYVYVGLPKEVVVEQRIQPGVRVTVKLEEKMKEEKKKKKKKFTGHLVSCAEPREQKGVYWGFTTRMASSLSNVWSECPFATGYDLKIGTSERGNVSVDEANFCVPTFKHALVVFGGVAGLEECVDADETLPVSGTEAHTLFDLWLNTCPHQGSRTIRSEEALLISLAALRPHIVRTQCVRPN